MMRKGRMRKRGKEFPPLILCPERIPSPGDLFGQQMGIPTSARRAKRPYVDATTHWLRSTTTFFPEYLLFSCLVPAALTPRKCRRYHLAG
jgi:hypothetical protein